MARTPKNAANGAHATYAAAEVSDYLALTPIQHDLVDYAAGMRLELTEAEAAPLLAVGAVTDKPTKAQLAALLVDQPEDEPEAAPAATE